MFATSQALEAAAVGAGDRPVERSDARAIQSAVQRATGGPPTAGGLAAAAMSAADLNLRVPTADKTTLEDILMVCFSLCHHRLHYSIYKSLAHFIFQVSYCSSSLVPIRSSERETVERLVCV